jgi:trypsin
MFDILRCQRASGVNVKLRLPFIIYCLTILFQALTVRVLADVPVSANTADPAYSHMPSKPVKAQIVGGEPATEGEFPYMAAIYMGDYSVCNGVILSSQWVLTWAGCLVDPNGERTSTSFELYVPKNEIMIGYGSIRNTTLKHVPIKDVWAHPQYAPPNYNYNNLALIKLETPLPLSEKWSPVRITPKIVSPGDKLIMVSWGSKSDIMSLILQKIQLTAGSYSECESSGQSGEHVCTVDEHGRGICYGDGASPLVLPTLPEGDANFAGYLVGIMNSFSTTSDSESDDVCERHSGINYSTRVAKHIDWIASVMGVDSSELLATPKTSEFDDDKSSSESDSGFGGRFRFPNSAVSFPMKNFDDTLRSIVLCSLILVVIAFNN